MLMTHNSEVMSGTHCYLALSISALDLIHICICKGKNPTILLKILYTTRQDFHAAYLVYWMPVRKDRYI